MPALVASTGTGDPSAGGWIQMDAVRGADGGLKRSSTTTSAFTRYSGSNLSGDSKVASTCGFAANSGRSNCGSLE